MPLERNDDPSTIATAAGGGEFKCMILCSTHVQTIAMANKRRVLSAMAYKSRFLLNNYIRLKQLEFITDNISKSNMSSVIHVYFE